MHIVNILKSPIKRAYALARVKSDIHLPLLRTSPGNLCFVIVLLESVKSNWVPESLMINDRVTPVYHGAPHEGGLIFICPPENFDLWENIIALPLKLRSKGVRLIPVSKGQYENFTESSLKDLSRLIGTDLHLDDDQAISKHLIRSNQSEEDSIKQAVDYLRRSQNMEPCSSFRGTFYTAFDMESRGYRVLSWIWTSAAVIRALIGEAVDNMDSGIKDDLEFCGEALLSLQIDEGFNRGGYMVRWDIWPQSPSGIVPWLSPNDAGFIGANGLLPMYEFTGDERYLHAAEDIAEWIMGPGTRPDGLVFVGYDMSKRRWVKEWLYVDAAFVVVLFERLHEVRGDERYPAWVERFMQEFIVHFRLANGLFRAFLRKKRERPNYIFTRGQAWVMDTLLSSYRLLKKTEFLEMAQELAYAIEPYQRLNGAWHYNLLDSDSGEDAKAIPILAHHLIDLYTFAQDPRIIEMATRALTWCRRNQVPAEDHQAGGGISSYTIEGTIAGKRNARIIFSYSVAYYILALRKLQRLSI